jgi:hypothetical protein
MGTNAEHDDTRRGLDLPEASKCPKVVADLLASQSGPRARVIDEHNFTVPGAFVPGTFRVQIFTGPALRPVAVATQTDNEGNSLSNDSWEYCAAVWRTLLPEESAPPIWIKRMLLDWINLPDYQISVLQATGDGYRVAGVCGTYLTADQAAELVGAHIDPGRGERFARLPEPPPTYALRYRVAWVAALPRTSHRSDDRCMTARGVLARRVLRQLVPRRAVRQCCWYHQGDWRAVSALAVKLLGAARRAGIEDARFHAWAVDQAAAQDLTEWQTSALGTLLNPAVSIHVGKGGYTNGNHRTRAMLDAGVRRTVVTDLEPLPPVPAPADPATDRRLARDERTG